MTATAPTVLPAKAPTRFVTIGGSQLALPPGARLDLAYTFTDQLPPQQPPIAFSYVVGGDYYEIPLTVFAALTITANTYPAVAVFEVFDPAQNSITIIPAPVQQPADSNRYVYNFGVGLGAAYTTNDFPASSGGQSFSAIPLPPLLLAPGFTWLVGTIESDLYTGNWEFAYVQSLRIPSQSAAAAPPRPKLQLT